jgi:hypothetical protein
VLPRLFKRERPGGRILVLEVQIHAEEPLMLTEFGAIAFSRDRQALGVTRAATRPRNLRAATVSSWTSSATCRCFRDPRAPRFRCSFHLRSAIRSRCRSEESSQNA